jgi:hypothetical protein
VVVKVARNGNGMLCFSSTRFRPVNQLQYTNRQLHHETRDWEIRYNDMGFEGTLEISPTEHFANFIKHLSPMQYRHIRKVYLNPQTSSMLLWNKATQEQIYRLFVNNNAAQVHFRVIHLSVGVCKGYFLLIALSIAMAARGNGSFAECISADLHDREQLMDIFGRDMSKAFQSSISRAPSNVRFLPFEAQLDETSIWLDCLNCTIVAWLLESVARPLPLTGNLGSDVTKGPVEGGRDVWVELFKDVFEKGV